MKEGFLPLDTTTGDRVFISVVVLFAIHLLWMRYVEEYLPLEVAFGISLVIAVVILKWG